jgi:hypothetical protein
MAQGRRSGRKGRGRNGPAPSPPEQQESNRYIIGRYFLISNSDT